ncbi:MAG: alpha/beta hydrolase-fold protein [Pseudomonadota bacterium]
MANTQLQTSHFETSLVPGPVTYSVLLPPDYDASHEHYALLYWLHGGEGDHRFLEHSAVTFEQLWADGVLPQMVVVTPTATQTGYLDYHDGSQRWETLLTDEFLIHLRRHYRLMEDRSHTFISGVSMGGGGALNIGLKHPDLFGAILAWEPFVDAAFDWSGAKSKNLFYQVADPNDKFGDPIDEGYWAANNPATIVRENADTIRDAGIHIYLEVGSEDALELNRGTDFLHRVLFDHDIRHEYRLVAGADHVGESFNWRIPDGLTFLNRIMQPATVDPVVTGFRKWATALRDMGQNRRHTTTGEKQ